MLLQGKQALWVMTFRGGVQAWGGWEGDPKQHICSDEQKENRRKQQPRCQRDDNIYNCSARGKGCGSCSGKVNTEVALCVRVLPVGLFYKGN